MSKNLFRLAAFIAICLMAGLTASAQEFQKSYSIGAGGKIRLSSASGDILVKGYSGESIQVSAFKMGRDRDRVEVEDLSSGNIVELRTRYPENCNCNASIRFEVMVPSETKYDFEKLSAASGDISITGVRGSALVKTASGDVEVTGFDGALNVSAASGDIHITDVSGTVNARTASGDLNVEIAKLGGTEAMEFSSASGDVDVALPANLDAEVSLSTSSGSLESAFPLDMKDHGRGPRRQAQGRLGSGSRVVRISTASGDVKLRRL